MRGVGHWAVIPAAGAGRRMRSQVPKQYLKLSDRTVIEHSLSRFIEHPRIDGIVVAIDAADHRWSSLRLASNKPLTTVTGGAERCHSVLNALAFLAGQARPDDWVLVHDAVRACLAREDLDRLISVLEDEPVGGLLATKVRDTLKREDNQGRVSRTVDRTALWHALTPQMFRLQILHSALQKVVAEGIPVTDEAAAVERAGFRPQLVEGRGDNIKITHPEDLALAEMIITAQANRRL
jgi:2-C-methyl-D-erythritol 4-phosphate cytidylyltransferase